MRKSSPTVLRYLGALYGGGALDGYSDGQLLERFTANTGVADRTEAELAFATLLDRHGRLVWCVCRSLVLNDHDAEDAFQATFLVLIRKAGSLRVRLTLGPWLFAVANRVGMSARAASLRRRTIERAAGARVLLESDARTLGRTSEIEEMGALLLEEVMRLPERYRAPVVLCDIEGITYQHAAARLDIPLGTLQSRLARARERLRNRLTRRGFCAFDSTDGHDWTHAFLPAGALRLVPPISLELATCRLCLSLVAEPAGLHAIVSSSVEQLVTKGLNSMLLTRLNAVASVPIAVIVLCGGILFNNQTKAEPRQEKVSPSKKNADVSKPKTAIPSSAKSKTLTIPALREQKAASGRGKAPVYALDENGDRIPNLEAVRPRQNRRIVAAIDNGDPTAKRPKHPEAPSKEVIADLSWVVVTGVVDQRAVESSLANRGRVGRRWAEQVYRRVELEKQERSSSGGWSDWQAVDPAPTLRVLENVPEVEFEKTPDELRLTNLVDMLPYLKAGEWTGVDVDRFVPAVREKKAIPQIGKDRGRQVPKPRLPEPPLPSLLMTRQLDFTVESGHTYKYRARLVVDDVRLRWKEVASGWSEPTEPVTVP